MTELPLVFLVTSVLLLLSIFSSKLAEKFGFPALLMFLVIGMLAGSDGPGGIHFDNAATANMVGTVALAFILFAGGLDTQVDNIRPVLGRGITMATLGVALSALFMGLFVHYVLGFSLQDGFLLGSIVSSTDAAAVFAVLRSRRVSLKGNLRTLLELESGSNDPMAIFLTLAVLQVIQQGSVGWGKLVPLFIIQISMGAAGGWFLGKVSARLINRIRLDYAGLYPVLGTSIVLLTYGLVEKIGGNGFLAVYVCGLVLGNSDFIYKRSLLRFHDSIGWLMQIIMFLVLGLLVFPSHLVGVVWEGLLCAGFLMFIARPVAILLTLIGSSFSLRERLLASWAGLRGAVPIVLATFPLLMGHPRSNEIFNVVFFIVLTSVLFQGKTLMPLARFLKVDKPLLSRPRYPLEFDKTENDVRNETRELDILPGTFSVGKTIGQLSLPSDALILLVRREKNFLVPRGQLTLEPYDTLLVLGEPDALQKVRDIINRKEEPAE
ncbi:MAG: potassium/proton antiporter [Aminobacterium sp.]|jgi:cell volume regulation protein A|uniref:potassium/proton antiporter n=1 Tax=unclassified Aminobacterium TaxID=2685012 RepID=UPI001BCB9CA5|nr:MULTISPECIES: potassium/proton antiporter [unclassified Aminobacterium]MDD2206830.1 potassium/proton antiporter [Aminobacterium sp.]MDD3426604.1 potassium/proton antiporter [Aminobacterium sp.]MDD4228524.1 potassium/proton antiporter [Aminobacterium sp.]MDD4551500.1 potassium/proton antiporter [Aminobacterium sp.]MEA4876667.1 potassium/proton antiporter [Aminobacterium sp.]